MHYVPLFGIVISIQATKLQITLWQLYVSSQRFHITFRMSRGYARGKIDLHYCLCLDERVHLSLYTMACTKVDVETECHQTLKENSSLACETRLTLLV